MRYGELAKAVAREREREIAGEPNPADKCLKCRITRLQASSEAGGSYCEETTTGFHVWGST